MTRAALYCRVSTDLQEKEHTIQSQLEALRKYAQDKGYQLVAEYLDDGYSGATLERPRLTACGMPSAPGGGGRACRSSRRSWVPSPG